MILDDRPAGDSENGMDNPRDTSLFLRLVSRDLGESFADFRRRFDDLTEEPNLIRLRENLGELTESVYRMDRLVRDLADTADIESGNLTLKEESFDLAALLSGQISKRLRRLRGYRIQPEIPSSPLTVTGDPDRFATLINDLLDAVILLSPGGGTVLIRLMRGDSEISLAVENRGAKLPPGKLETILDWLDTCLQEKEGFEGVGLGLYRTHLTVQMWNGRLDVAMPPEGGLLFTLRIPHQSLNVPKNE